MSKLNVYQWIRDGVRRAVLLGFSDAVEQLGAPEQGHELNPHLVSLLRETKPRLAEPELVAAETSAEPPAAAPRRRLGRSLDQLRAARDKAEGPARVE